MVLYLFKADSNTIELTLLVIRFDLSSNQNQKIIEKKFAGLTARAVLLAVFLQKPLIYDFLAGNNYPDSPHS